ncbi:unnamed protein product [Ceratitis capitata]|uniref:(Mediterranean fruit fly) hypothetical protein n=1 Tax=Ceratitis capitata TaxID=7213 RepID=A0A811U3Z4_CERCA|nr:unnamed protein product [Ceratitis capitata]
MYLESAPLHCSSSSIAFGSTTVHLSSVIDVAKAHFHGFTGGRQFNWFVCASRTENERVISPKSFRMLCVSEPALEIKN